MKEKKGRLQKKSVILIVVVGFLFFLFGATISWLLFIPNFGQQDRSVQEIFIPAGTTFPQIVQLLDDNNLIHGKRSFWLAAKLLRSAEIFPSPNNAGVVPPVLIKSKLCRITGTLHLERHMVYWWKSQDCLREPFLLLIERELYSIFNWCLKLDRNRIMMLSSRQYINLCSLPVL